MGRPLKLHQLVLIALAIRAILAGIIGAFPAVPIAAILWSAVKGWNDTPEEHKNHEQKGQGKTS